MIILSLYLFITQSHITLIQNQGRFLMELAFSEQCCGFLLQYF